MEKIGNGKLSGPGCGRGVRQNGYRSRLVFVHAVVAFFPLFSLFRVGRKRDFLVLFSSGQPLLSETSTRSLTSSTHTYQRAVFVSRSIQSLILRSAATLLPSTFISITVLTVSESSNPPPLPRSVTNPCTVCSSTTRRMFRVRSVVIFPNNSSIRFSYYAIDRLLLVERVYETLAIGHNKAGYGSRKFVYDEWKRRVITTTSLLTTISYSAVICSVKCQI